MEAYDQILFDRHNNRCHNILGIEICFMVQTTSKHTEAHEDYYESSYRSRSPQLGTSQEEDAVARLRERYRCVFFSIYLADSELGLRENSCIESYPKSRFVDCNVSSAP